MSSLLRKTGRGIGRMDTDEYTKQFEALDPKWGDPAVWVAMMQSPGIAEALPETASAWGSWQRIVANKNDVLAEEQPEDFIYTMLYRDLVAQPASAIAPIRGAGAEMLRLPTARLTASRSSPARTVSRHRRGLGRPADLGDHQGLLVALHGQAISFLLSTCN
jgi:hypothetical protein